jgi:hypothetical protein
MATYRIYFFGTYEVVGRHEFDADSDIIAIPMAQALFDACSDICWSFDLWQGSRYVSVPRLLHKMSVVELSAASQERVIQKLETKRPGASSTVD